MSQHIEQHKHKNVNVPQQQEEVLLQEQKNPASFHSLSASSLPPLTPNNIMHLQSVIGNRAVQRIMGKAKTTPINTSANTTVVQREDQPLGGVTHFISPIQQPTSMVCWATVSTMMASWRDSQAYTVADIATVVGRAGAQYTTMVNNNQGLPGSQKDAFLAAFGLRAEPPTNFTARGLSDLLQGGPLWVTTDGGTVDSVHARVVVSIMGDGSPDGTTLQIVDPATGQLSDETFARFTQRYENVAIGDMADGGSFRAQVVHY